MICDRHSGTGTAFKFPPIADSCSKVHVCASFGADGSCSTKGLSHSTLRIKKNGLTFTGRKLHLL
jgi:hypothetical protein